MRTKVIGSIVLCVVLILTGVACKTGPDCIDIIDGMTASEIMDKAADAEFETVRYMADWDMTVEGEEIFSMAEVGTMDITNSEMYSIGEMSMNIPPFFVMTADMKTYSIGDWIYTGRDTGEGMEWCKEPSYESEWDEYNMTDEQLALLDDFIDVCFLGNESIMGIECYKIDMRLDSSALMEWATTQAELGGIEDYSVIVWIAKDTYYPVQMEIHVASSYQGMTESTTMTMTMYSFDSPVFISLPAEAADAYEGCYSYEESY